VPDSAKASQWAAIAAVFNMADGKVESCPE